MNGSMTKPLLFNLPWGRALRKTILVKTDKGLRYQTDAYFKGSGYKYAESFLNENGTNATELLVRADKALAVLPEDNFWKDVRRAALRALKAEKK
jgi:hypothetical protein